MRSVIAIITGFLLWLAWPFHAQTAERKTELKVIYDAPRLSVEARGVSFLRVLEEIGAKVGFVVVDYGGSDKPLTVSIQDASVQEVLEHLLRGENYAFIYEGQRKGIEKVLLLTSSAKRSVESPNQQYTDRRQESMSQSQSGLTYHPSLSQPAPLGEHKRGDKSEAEVRVADIVKVHALSGLADSAGFFPEPGNAPQAFRSPGFSAGRRIAKPLPQDIHETLAVTTRLAQQNLKALVDALGTASNSLFDSLSKSGR
jgi:hypothetical protein